MSVVVAPRAPSLLLFACVCLPATAVCAQSSQPPPVPSSESSSVRTPVRIDATTADPSAVDEIDSIDVVGIRRPLRQVPGAATVLDRATITEGQRQSQLSEALQRVPGFTALDRQNPAQDLQVQSRGFGARSTFGIRGLRLIVDGIPATAADGQGQAAAFPLSSLDRIEVLRGPLALALGNAAGGAIVGRSRLDGVDATELSLWIDDDGGRRVAARLDGGDADVIADVDGNVRPRGGDRRWRLGASRHVSDGLRGHDASRRHQFNAIGAWRIGDAGELRLVYNGLRQPLAQDPLGLTRAAFERDPASADPVASQFDTRKTVREDQFGLRWRSARDVAGGDDAVDDAARGGDVVGAERVDPRGGGWLSAWRVDRAVEQFLAIPVAAQRPTGSAGGVVDLRRASFGAEAGYRFRFAHGTLVLGAETARLDEDRCGYENFLDGGALLGVRGRLRRDERNRVDSLDLFVSGEWSFDPHWRLQAGLRRSRLRFDSRDRFLANGDDSGGRRDARSAWSLGLVRAYAHGEGYASVGAGFETPTLNEMAYRPDGGAGFNRDLAPARMHSGELGARWRGAWGEASLAVFRIDGRDDIVPALNRGGRASFANAGATRREGVEFGASGDVVAFGERWRYTVAASWIDARFVEDFRFVAQGETRVVARGNRIPGVPRADVFAEWGWRSRDAHWRAALEARIVGAITVDDRNTDRAAGNARFALRGEWRAGDTGWHAFARIDNLFDRTYAGSVIVNEGNGRFFEPGPGRAVTLGIGWRARD